ncbi:MAG: hypothetical protein HWE22_17195 [Flavobacteriales bacterium]|nr:hypothetical protein [Flavobacteriales bacterium]
MNFQQGVSLLILGLIHLTFLLTLGIDNSVSNSVRAVLIPSLALLIIAYVRIPRSNQQHSKIELFLTPFLVAAATGLTYYISVDLRLGPVIASAAIGLAASYLPNLVELFRKRSNIVNTLPAAIYCGTFAGMSSSFVAPDYFVVSYIGLATGAIYMLTRQALNGVGGKLGTIAFGGVFIVSLIYSAL